VRLKHHSSSSAAHWPFGSLTCATNLNVPSENVVQNKEQISHATDVLEDYSMVSV